MGKRPVSSIVRQSSTGHATNIIGGLAVGMERCTVLPVIVFGSRYFLAHICAGIMRISNCGGGYDVHPAMRLAPVRGPVRIMQAVSRNEPTSGRVRGRTDILE